MVGEIIMRKGAGRVEIIMKETLGEIIKRESDR